MINMGAKVSSFTSLPDNALLLRFVGDEHIGREDDRFWDELLAFKFNTPIAKYVSLVSVVSFQQILF